MAGRAFSPPKSLLFSPVKRYGFIVATVVLAGGAVMGSYSVLGYLKKRKSAWLDDINLEQLYAKATLWPTTNPKDLFVSGVIGSVLGSGVFITARMFIPRKAYAWLFFF
jgi:hypothetical protein